MVGISILQDLQVAISEKRTGPDPVLNRFQYQQSPLPREAFNKGVRQTSTCDASPKLDTRPMQTERWTPTASHPQGVDCEQSSLIGIRIQQGNRNSTDFTKQATCNHESLPRKKEHKELLFSVGPVLLLDHLEVPYIEIDSDLTTTTEKKRKLHMCQWFLS